MPLHFDQLLHQIAAAYRRSVLLDDLRRDGRCLRDLGLTLPEVERALRAADERAEPARSRPVSLATLQNLSSRPPSLPYSARRRVEARS